MSVLAEQFLSERLLWYWLRARGVGGIWSTLRVCVDLFFLMEPISFALNQADAIIA